MKTFKDFESLLKEFNELKEIIKTLSAVYQIQSKEEAALAFNKPLNYYYHFSYEKWSRVSKRLVIKREKVMAECNQMGIPGNMPYSEFPHYRQRMGLDNGRA